MQKTSCPFVINRALFEQELFKGSHNFHLFSKFVIREFVLISRNPHRKRSMPPQLYQHTMAPIPVKRVCFYPCFIRPMVSEKKGSSLSPCSLSISIYLSASKCLFSPFVGKGRGLCLYVQYNNILDTN